MPEPTTVPCRFRSRGAASQPAEQSRSPAGAALTFSGDAAALERGWRYLRHARANKGRDGRELTWREAEHALRDRAFRLRELVELFQLSRTT